MMASGDRLGEPVKDATGSGLRVVRRWKVLLAHVASASTCDLLLDAIEGALGNVDVTESSSVDDARLATRRVPHDIVMVCLDLPPAPMGGVRLAEELVARGVPVVLVTRSLRWIPPSALALREVPWIPPDADVTDVSRAVHAAIANAIAGRDTPEAAPRRVRAADGRGG
jgi:hypothetical protein